jgi:hypothetical protein
MIEQIATAIGLKTVEKLFDAVFTKKDTDADIGAISIGLAVGYYYNFLEPVSGVIDRDEFELFDAPPKAGTSPKEGDSRKFASEDISVNIIIPSRLDVAVYKRCEAEFDATRKGFIYLRQQKRYYGVNYTLTESPVKLTIVDLARPIMSAKRYYEDIRKQDTHDDLDEQWLKIQVGEITAFKEAIRRLQKRGYGGLVNKLDFRERS